MLIVICSFLLILAVLFIWLAVYNYDECNAGLTACGILLSVADIIALIICLCILIGYIGDVSTAHTIDSKIAMCEEENAAIEEKINTTITYYLEHENSTLTSLTPENATTILAVYPELKSDALVASQIDTYIANYNEIKSLKEDKIDISAKKWWVYFGK